MGRVAYDVINAIKTLVSIREACHPNGWRLPHKMQEGDGTSRLRLPGKAAISDEFVSLQLGGNFEAFYSKEILQVFSADSRVKR